MASKLVKSVTSDKDMPPNGPDLHSLAQCTFKSHDECAKVRKLLFDRLKKSSPVVKWKALRAIKYVAINGRDAFRMGLQRQDENAPVRECVNFRGKLDPLKKDRPNQRVRDEAKAALHAIYNGGTTQSRNTMGRIQGMGSTGGGGGGGGQMNRNTNSMGSSSSNRDTYKRTYYTPNSKTSSPPPQSTSKYGSMSSSGFSSPGRVNSGNNNNNNNNQTFNRFQGSGSYNNDNQMNNNMNSMNNNSQTNRNPASRGFGGFRGTSGSFNNNSNTNNGQNPASRGFSFKGNAPVNNNSSGTTSSTTGASVPKSDGTYERTLIRKVSHPAGMRTGLSAREKKQFLSSVASLDQSLVARILNEELLESMGKQTSKLLDMITALLKADNHDVEDYFYNNPENLQEVMEEGGGRGKKARNILVLLGMEEEEKLEKKKSVPVAVPRVVPQQQPQQQQPQQQQTTTTTQNTLDEDILGAMSSKPTTQTSDSQPGMQSMFGDLQVRTQSSPDLPAAPHPTPADPLDDIFGPAAPKQGASTSTQGNNNTSGGSPGGAGVAVEDDPLNNLFDTGLQQQQQQQQQQSQHQTGDIASMLRQQASNNNVTGNNNNGNAGVSMLNFGGLSVSQNATAPPQGGSLLSSMLGNGNNNTGVTNTNNVTGNSNNGGGGGFMFANHRGTVQIPQVLQPPNLQSGANVSATRTPFASPIPQPENNTGNLSFGNALGSLGNGALLGTSPFGFSTNNNNSSGGTNVTHNVTSPELRAEDKKPKTEDAFDFVNDLLQS